LGNLSNLRLDRRYIKARVVLPHTCDVVIWVEPSHKQPYTVNHKCLRIVEALLFWFHWRNR